MTPKVDELSLRYGHTWKVVESKIETKVGIRHSIHLVSNCPSRISHGRNLLIVILGLF